MIEFDVETTGLQPYSGKQEAFLYCFFDGNESEHIYQDEPDARERTQRWFDRAKDEGCRAWNTKFDRAWADQEGYDIPGDGMWRDGMIDAHVIDERRSIALKAVGSDLFPGADDLQKQVHAQLAEIRKERKKKAKEEGTELVEPNYSDVDRELMTVYGLEDVFLTRKVCDVYEPRIENSPDLKKIVEFETEVLDALYAVEKRGIPVDEEAYRKLELEVMENLERMEDNLQNLAGDPDYNPNAHKQTLEALKRRGADLTFVTGDSMDKENLETVDDELAAAVLDFRSEAKVLSTYVHPAIHRHYDTSIRSWVEQFVAPDGRIHANYRQVGARTGRMSCSGPNIQNQPRDDLRLRYNFRAEEGKKLVTCDLSGIEMCVFAAYAGEGALLDAIKTGADLHQMTADFIGIRDRVRAGGYVETARQRGKTFNFSIVYGGGIKTIRKQQRVDQKTARQMLNRYHDAYPEVGKLQNRILWRLHDQGYVKSLLGRRYRSDNPDREGYKYLNYVVQGGAAEILKMALVRLHKDGVPVVGLVHDEVIAHVDESDAEEAKHTIIEALTDHPIITEKVPLAAEGDIVDRWSDAKPLKDGSLFVPNWAKGA